MPTRKYALDPGGPQRLQLQFGVSMSQVQVRLDDQPVATLEGAAVKSATGQDATLPDGTVLNVRVQRGFSSQLLVTRDGKPVLGSDGDPLHRVRQAANLLYFLAVLNIAIGGVVSLLKPDFLVQVLGSGVTVIVEGVVFGVLGFFVSRQSRPAMVMALGFYALDTLFTLTAMARSGGSGIGGVIMHAFILMYFWRGYQAMQSLRPSPTAITEVTPS